MQKNKKSRSNQPPLSLPSSSNDSFRYILNAHEITRGKPLVMSLIVFSALLTLYFCFPASYFETNDDAVMNLLLAGEFAIDKPNAYPLNLNVLLSKSLVLLYTFLPGIKWYPLMQVASIFFATCYINYILFLIKGEGSFLLQLATTLVTAIPFLIYIQFTKTAFVLGFLSIIGLLLISQNTEKVLGSIGPYKLRLLYSLGFLGVIVSYCIRNHSLYLALLLTGFWALETFLKGTTYRRVFFFTAFVSVLSLHAWNKNHYDESWEKALRITLEVVASMTAYNQIDYQENAEVFKEAGLSFNDVVVMTNWGAVDRKVFSDEKTDYLMSHLKKRKAQLVNIKPALLDAVSAPALSYLLCVVFLTAVLLVCLKIPMQRTLCVTMLLVALSVVFLVITGWLPPRVSCPIIFSIPWFLMAFFESPRFSRKTHSGIIAVAFALSLPLVFFQIQDLGKVISFRKSQNLEIHRLADAIKAPTLVISWGAAFPIEGIRPFESYHYLENMRNIFFASHNQTPLQLKQFEINKIDDVFMSMLERDNIYLAISPGLLGIVHQYYLEHYSKDVRFSLSFQSEHMSIFKLIEHQPPK